MARWGPRNDGQRGISLPELLVVIALLGLTAMVTIPITARRIHELRIRSAADQFVVALRASRMVAVTTGKVAEVQVDPHPANAYTFVDSKGREHRVGLPAGVRATPASTPTVRFAPNGALDAIAPATIELQARVGRDANGDELFEVWTITTPLNGIPTVTSSRSTSGW